MNCRLLLILAVLFLFCPFNGQASPTRLDSIIDAPKPEPLAAPAKIVTHDPKLSAKPSELHRLDFRIENRSCAACLLRIQAKLKCLNGVEDAAVMVKRPFGVSIVYKSDKASAEYLIDMLRANQAGIKVTDIADSKIESMPIPLIPPFLPPADATNTGLGNQNKPMNGGL